MDYPCLQTFQIHLGAFLCHPALPEGWTWCYQGSLKTVILWGCTSLCRDRSLIHHECAEVRAMCLGAVTAGHSPEVLPCAGTEQCPQLPSHTSQ